MKTRLKGQRILAAVLAFALVITVVPFTKANAADASYVITAQVANSEDCGTVSGGGAVNQGDNVTLVATPKTGWRFLYWLDQWGGVVSVDPTYTFTPTCDCKYYANFESTTSGLSYSATVVTLLLIRSAKDMGA